MSKYVVLTDSTCDLPEEAAKQHNIDIVCFKIALDGEGYTERVDFTPEQFCEMLKKASGLPTTAQITQFEFFDKFEEYDRQGVEQTLYISINAGGSGTNAAAHAAAAQFHEEHPDSRMEIFIVDSHAYSMAEGAGVIEAKQKLDAGETMESVVEYLNDKYAKMEILLTAYTLKVIRKSGRISAAAAIAGDLLGIHPIFTLNDGVSQVVKKVRGDKAVVSSMATTMASRMAQGTPYYIGVSDHKYDEEYVEACTKKVGYAPVGIFHLGCAVLSNTGAEAVGLVFEGAKRER
ncbi:MAG: DegV family protein [Christensenellales bacterium]|nr:DegV family protein [Christensenellales bacterium]